MRCGVPAIPEGLMMRLFLAMLVTVGLFADGYFQIANAQCKPSDGKIYIDPRLVPTRPANNITPELQQKIQAWMANPWVSEWQKKRSWII